MSELTSKPDHRDLIIQGGRASVRFQLFLDDIQQEFNNSVFGAVLLFASYTVATVPDATEYLDGAIIVSDETGGRTIATSDGTDWRRVSDGAVIS